MKTLRDYLLQEQMITEAKSEAEKELLGKGYKKIGRQGTITKELKDLLNIVSAKELNLKAGKISDALKVSTKEGRQEIKDELELSGTEADYFATIKKAIESDTLSKIFVKILSKSKNSISLQLKSSYGSVAKKTASSQKFIKFWLECACIANGFEQAPMELKFYVSENGEGLNMVVNKD